MMYPQKTHSITSSIVAGPPRFQGGEHRLYLSVGRMLRQIVRRAYEMWILLQSSLKMLFLAMLDRFIHPQRKFWRTKFYPSYFIWKSFITNDEVTDVQMPSPLRKTVKKWSLILFSLFLEILKYTSMQIPSQSPTKSEGTGGVTCIYLKSFMATSEEVLSFLLVLHMH